jgi:hypothetical protein
MNKFAQEQFELIRELRQLVLNFNGPIAGSPHYDMLAKMLVSECMLDVKYDGPLMLVKMVK